MKLLDMKFSLNRYSKVAVIGAGPSGLSAAKHVLAQGVENLVVYEKSDDIGGIWRYTEQASHSHATPMYQNLKINVPKECMGYIDMPLVGNRENSFVTHFEVQEYLHKYAEKFGLKDKIRLSSRVEKLTFNDPGWSITANNQTESFDYVIIANGHYTTPDFPQCFNNGQFRGQTIHASSYRKG